MADKQVLVAEDLTKKYGHAYAVRDLSFSLEAGKILGFLGPNGAGKTTAIRMLTTMLPTTSGSFSVGGIPGDSPAGIRRIIGVLPESEGVPAGVTGLELLVYTGRLYGMPRKKATEKALELLERVGLGKRGKSYVSTYSRGMRQRLGIARAIIHDPDVVFFDEPTLGLDPQGQEELLSLIRWCARDLGAAVVLCSHMMQDVERVCDQVLILNEGIVVAQGAVSDVIERTANTGFRIQVPTESVEGAIPMLEGVEGVIEVRPPMSSDGWIEVEMKVDEIDDEDGTQVHQVLVQLIQGGVPLLGLQTGSGRLHDAFLSLTGVSA